MDTKDISQELSSPGIMAPDSGPATSIEPELVDLVGTEPGVPVLDGQPPKKSPTPLQDSLRRLRRDVRAMVSLGVVLLFVVIALIGPFIYQHIGGPYNSTLNGVIGPDRYHTFSNEELDRQDELPSAQYWLGTDDLGRDILARLMQGMLISLSVAILVEILDIVLGVLIGVLAGYYGGWIDQLLARFTDIMFAFPGLLFAILLTGIFGVWADTNLDNIPVICANGNARLLVVSVDLAFVACRFMPPC